MNKKILVLVIVSILLISNVFAYNAKEKVRVIAHSKEEVSSALNAGCEIVRETKGLTALVCSENIAEFLKLDKDIKAFAVDTNANKQVKADVVQNSGNNGAGRKIVILDTGYNYNHPELSSSYLGGKDFVNNDFDPMDDNGHGSHVAGLITGDGIMPQAKGVAPAAGVLSGKVLNADGSGYFSDIIAAIYWAVNGYDGVYGTLDDPNADAISMSIGSSAPYLYKGFCDSVIPDLTTAINYARSKNVLVVVAAGNSGNAGVSIPGCVSYSTTVGAVDRKDKVASFSGRGSAVDITAPGVNLLSAWIGNSYVTASGTSMATPVLSGVIALIKNAHPAYSINQTENKLFTTAKDLGTAGKDNNYGYGRVDASKAVI